MQKHTELPQAFADLGVEVRLLKGLQKMGFVTPSEIQAQLIPAGLRGVDILGQARTGTGKTAAFGIPVLQQIDPKGRLQAICLAPTRELAVQVTGELQRIAAFAEVHIVAVYGGQKVASQLHHLGRRPHFVVGTPGRVMDFMQRGVLPLTEIRFVVLDEVDRMLDIGFRDDIRAILGRCTAPHQTIFVSATIEGEIKSLAKRYMREPEEINVSKDHLTVDEVDQYYVTVEPYDKFRLLRLLLEQEKPPIAIIFCNTKHGARKLSKKLFDVGIASKEIHGDLDQRKRERVMEGFRKHHIKVLVATDLASRGIDVSAISHIVNYDLPPDPEVYVHRVGRTARMGARGIAISLVTREEGTELTRIEMLINREIPARTIEGFVPSPERPDPFRRPEPQSAGPKPSEGATRASAPATSPASSSSTTTRPSTPRTLGGKFRPARGRRRL